MKSRFLLCILFLLNAAAFSQSRYALLIGINNYYKKEKGKIVIDPDNSLHGCVNDARSMKELLMQRFGFKKANVREVYDSMATKKKIFKEISDLLKRCKPGDVVVFYYSGHGMTFPYGENAAQTAEAICPSDIFTSVNFYKEDAYEYSFIETSELAALFNKFVDKKVVLTSIFDCCYSTGTIGVKKTSSTKTLVNGIQMIKNTQFWEEQVEMSKAAQELKIRSGLIQFGAMDQDGINICDTKSREAAIQAWLSSHGNANTNDLCPGSPLSWTNDYDPSKWKAICDGAGSVSVTFSVKDTCGHEDTTTATYSITDETRPEIILPARDTIIDCCGPADQLVLSAWLKRNGGAIAKDACPNLTWSNNFEQLKKDFDVSGTALITFTAKDPCGNLNSTTASFTIEDNKAPVEYQVSAQESRSVIDLLNNLDNIRSNVSRYGFNTNAWLRAPLTEQLAVLDSIKQKVKKVAPYEATGSLESIQGSPLMASLLKNIESLLVLLDNIPFEPQFHFVQLDIPVTDDGKGTDLLKRDGTIAYRQIDFKMFNLLKISEGNRDFAKGFPYKKFDFNPPSLVKGSKFLFISATNDKQKAVEIPDEQGIKHGVFTRALIDVLKKAPVGTGCTEVFDRIVRQFKDKKIVQSPMFRAAAGRTKQNIFGIRY